MRKILFIILFITITSHSISQVSNYAFSEEVGTYQAILGNVALGGWSGTANGTNNPPGGNTPTSTQIPFDFCYGGEIIPAGTTISMDFNGWIAFGTPSITAATRQQPLTHINNSISAFGTGLETQGNTQLSIRAFGNAPNRVLVFQWGSRFFGDYSNSGDWIGSNSYWKRVNGGDPRDYLHFQIRLYETSNIIEFHYLIGNPRLNTSGSITNNIQVGLRGDSNADFVARTKTTTGDLWNNNTFAATALPSGTSNTMNFNNQRNDPNNKPTFAWPGVRGTPSQTAGPGTGTIFRWTPSVAIDDDDGTEFTFDMPAEITICESDDVDIEILSTPVLGNYTWTASANNVSGATNGSGTSITDNLTVINGNSGFVDYTISPEGGACISEVIRVIVEKANEPTFSIPEEICENQSPPTLPTTSIEGITGTWNPAVVDNTQTTTYTFTPDASAECAETTEITITVSEVPPPSETACYETATFNEETCEWEISGTQPEEPTDLECGQTASFNPTTCEWEISGTGSNPSEPSTACYETATFNEETCEWEISGTQPEEPTDLECGQTTSFNSTTCEWEISGSSTNPAEPEIACYETAIFDEETCEWEISGTQPNEPTGLECYELATFDEQLCEWVIEGEPLDYEVEAANPASCDGGQTGEIVISNLMPNTDYVVSFNSETGTNYTSNGDGEIVLTNLAPGNYTSFVVSINGCDFPNSTSVDIEELSAPQVNAGQNQNICQGEAIVLSASNPDGADISWSSGVVDGQSFTPPAGTNTYTVTADLNGCTATDEVTIIVQNAPNVNAGNDITICAGETIMLNATGADSYSWSNNVINGQSFEPPVGTTVYTVTGESNGCSATDQVSVTVESATDVSFEVASDGACENAVITFINTSSSASSDCLWELGDETTLSGCSQVNHTYGQTGCFTVSLTTTTASGCTSTSTVSDAICVEGSPIADFTANPSVVTTENPTVNFTNQSSGATSYLWDFGDFSSFSSEVSPSHTYPNENDDFYEVILIATNDIGCSDTAVTIIEVRDELLYWVPNAFTPDNDKYNETFQPVFTSGFDPFNYKLLIFNRWGEVLFESNNAAVGWDGTYGGSIVQDGTYVWKIEFREKYTDKRIVETGHVILLR